MDIVRLRAKELALGDPLVARLVRIRRCQIVAIPACEVLYKPAENGSNPAHCEIRGDANDLPDTWWRLSIAARKVHYPTRWDGNPWS